MKQARVGLTEKSRALEELVTFILRLIVGALLLILSRRPKVTQTTPIVMLFECESFRGTIVSCLVSCLGVEHTSPRWYIRPSCPNCRPIVHRRTTPWITMRTAWATLGKVVETG